MTLDTTVESTELLLEYQPVVQLCDGALAGFETLSRFRAGGVTVMPDEFISEIISSGGLGQLTNTLLHRAPAEVAAYFAYTPVAVNVSVLQITDEAWLEKALSAYYCAPRQRIVWEITETEAAPDDDVAAAVERIGLAGFVTVMDDFDSGFSSMSRLASAHFDSVKIDRELISHVDVSKRHRAAVKAIVGLAAELDTRTVAEGIESARQAQILTDLGVEFGQGYFFGRPAPIEAHTERFLVAV